MSKEQYKAQAFRLAEHLATTYGWKLTHHKALNALAAAVGARNWNTLHASRPPVTDEHLDWGPQALARWAAGPPSGPLHTHRVVSRCAHYSADVRTAQRIERVSCGRLPGGLLARYLDGRVSLTEVHREEGSSFAVVSLSGAGKSHLMAELMVDTLRRGGAVHSLDAGNSHRKLCAMLNGHQATLNLSQPQGLSPFRHYAGADFNTDLREPLTELLLELFASHMEGRKDLLDHCHTEIGAALQLVWREHLQRSTFAAVLRVLKDSPCVELSGAASAVQANWATLGPWLDDCSPDVQTAFNHSFAVFDTSDLFGNPSIYNAVTMLLALHSFRALQSRAPAAPRLLVIEDADWTLRSMTRPAFWSQLQAQLDQAGCGLGVTALDLTRGLSRLVSAPLVERSLTVFVGRQRPDTMQQVAQVEPWNGVRELADGVRALRIEGGVPQFAVLQYLLPPKIIRLEMDSFTNLMISMRASDMGAKNALLPLPEAERAQKLLAMTKVLPGEASQRENRTALSAL
jgi:hypothetical protein